MIEYLRNRYRSACLRAEYERRVQEELLELTERRRGERESWRRMASEGGDWSLVGEGRKGIEPQERVDARSESRRLAVENPHARNILRLLEIYVVGPGLQLTHTGSGGDARSEKTARSADRLWERFLEENQQHYSFREHARRSWRDGEAFLRLYSQGTWPPTVRFVDPERIDTPLGGGEDPGEGKSQGILTATEDVERPTGYQVIDPASGELTEEVSGEEMLHTRVGVDSNQKRGLPILLPILEPLRKFEQWMETELQARRLQASIVLWRKVQGSASQVSQLADQLSGGSGDGGGRRERYRPGTIITTSQGTDLQFLQPNTNFADAIPLGRMLLLSMAAGEGMPEFMLTADASNGNYASTMVSEGPAVKMFQSEQQFFTTEFTRLWKWVMGEGMRLGELPGNFFERVKCQWGLPVLVNRDRTRERLADSRLVAQGVLSRAEVARREGVDPEVMRTERAKEEVSVEISRKKGEEC